jgi:MGT family glycosyltransferase
MKQIHIAFVVYLAHPSIGPTLPIVSVLVRRGYRVTYVTSDQFAPRVAAMGAEVILCSGVPDQIPSDGIDENGHFQDQLTRLAERTLEEVLPCYERDKPALIIYDYAALAGKILAKRLGVPAIQTSPCFAHDARVHSKQVRNPQFRESILGWGRLLDSFMARSGIPNYDFLFHREDLNIYLFPKILQPCADTIDESCFYAGRCAGEQPYYGSWQRGYDDGSPIVFVAASTLYTQGPEYFRMCVDALTGREWHVILSIGDAGNPASLGRLPSNVEIVQRVSHVKILPYVSMFICLGGIITTAESMYHGVPLIVTSHGFSELEYQADNIVDLGIGIHLPKGDLTVENLRRASDQVFADDSMRKRMEDVRRVVRRQPGAEDTVNRIEDYLNHVPTFLRPVAEVAQHGRDQTIHP